MHVPVSRFGLFIGPVFLLAAGWFMLGPETAYVPQTEPAQVPEGVLTTASRRNIVGDPPKIVLNNFERRCTDCHGIFDAVARLPVKRLQHAHIVLDHGINDACGNCHNLANMDQLVLYNGAPVTYAETPQLCRKCHGPTFQDWERGIHGRVNEYWNSQYGSPRKLMCIQCHDPHAPRRPAMDPLAPLPGPNTLRMRPAERAEDLPREARETDPLRRALRPRHTSSKGAPVAQEVPKP
jgi:hypothetical protein